MSFPITLIKLIAEYALTPYQLVEHELQTKGLPFLTKDICDQKVDIVWMPPELADRIPCKPLMWAPVGPDTGIWFPDILMMSSFRSDVAYPVGSLGEQTAITRKRHVKMRANLMAFHLSKV